MTTHNEGPALLDVKAVAALFQASPSTIWRRVNDGTFPQPVRMNVNSIRRPGRPPGVFCGPRSVRGTHRPPLFFYKVASLAFIPFH